MVKNKFKAMKRYFLVFFNAVIANGEKTISGVSTYEGISGKYVNRQKFVDKMLEFYKQSKIMVTHVTITNIIELDEADYLEFSKGSQIY